MSAEAGKPPGHNKRIPVSLPTQAHFVITHHDRWQDLLGGDAQGQLPPSPSQLGPRIVTNEDCWVVLTYVHLRRRGLPVRLQPGFVPGAVCVASSLDYGVRARRIEAWWSAAGVTVPGRPFAISR